jgi:hypothetical protein
MLLLGALIALGHAEDVGRLQGVVQRDGQGLANQRIMLIRFGPNQDVQRFPGQTDAEGRFLFEHLATGPTWTYVVGVRYQEQLYRSEGVTLEGTAPAEVTVQVGSTATPEALSPSAQPPLRPEAPPQSAQPPLRIVNHLIIIISHEADLEVREIVRLVNAGTTPYTAAGRGPRGTPGISLHLPLPPGHTNVSPIQGLLPEATRVERAGIMYTAPIDPGEHQVMYTYHLPWHAELTTVLVERTLGTAMLDVLVEDTQLNATSDLRFSGQVTIAPHVFAHFRGVQLEALSRSWLQMTPRQTTTAFLSLGTYGGLLGLLLCGSLWPCYRAWRRPERQNLVVAETWLDRQELHRTGQHLLQRMAHLDNTYAAGTLAAADYQQQRQAYKAQLVSLVEHCQRACVSPE